MLLSDSMASIAIDGLFKEAHGGCKLSSFGKTRCLYLLNPYQLGSSYEGGEEISQV